MINPWLREFWNISAQGAFVRQHGMTVATAYARTAGVEIGATKPAPDAPQRIIEQRTFIRNKNITTENVFVTEVGSRGYSGDGPPGEDV